MNILYDHQIFSSQKYGGISRYFFELIRGINQRMQCQTKAELLLKYSNNYYLQLDESGRCDTFFQNIDFKGKSIVINLANQLYTKLTLRSKEFDIYHPTYYRPINPKALKNQPMVITVFDMIHEKFPLMYKNKLLAERKLFLCNKADHIIAISNSTKKDLVDLYSIDPNKITTIHLANSLNVQKMNKPTINIPNQYILYVGSRKIYKNFDFFINTVAPILRSERDLYLICVGDNLDEQEKVLLTNLSINHQVFSYNASDTELVYFYRNAIFFIYPSLYEGFGLPLLESFACECPVLSSNAASLSEVGGNACKYFSPSDPEQLIKGVRELLSSKKLRNKLIKKGLQRSKCFSWNKCVSETLEVYNKVLAN